MQATRMLPERRGRGSWFGASTFVCAVTGMFVNIVPLTVAPSTLVDLLAVYVLELLAAAVLCTLGGRARRIGAGLAVAVFATAAILGLALLISILHGHQ